MAHTRTMPIHCPTVQPPAAPIATLIPMDIRLPPPGDDRRAAQLQLIARLTAQTHVVVHTDAEYRDVVEHELPNVVAARYTEDEPGQPPMPQPKNTVQWWRLRKSIALLDYFEALCGLRHAFVFKVRTDLVLSSASSLRGLYQELHLFMPEPDRTAFAFQDMLLGATPSVMRRAFSSLFDAPAYREGRGMWGTCGRCAEMSRLAKIGYNQLHECALDRTVWQLGCNASYARHAPLTSSPILEQGLNVVMQRTLTGDNSTSCKKPQVHRSVAGHEVGFQVCVFDIFWQVPTRFASEAVMMHHLLMHGVEVKPFPSTSWPRRAWGPEQQAPLHKWRGRVDFGSNSEECSHPGPKPVFCALRQPTRGTALDETALATRPDELSPQLKHRRQMLGLLLDRLRAPSEVVWNGGSNTSTSPLMDAFWVQFPETGSSLASTITMNDCAHAGNIPGWKNVPFLTMTHSELDVKGWLQRWPVLRGMPLGANIPETLAVSAPALTSACTGTRRSPLQATAEPLAGLGFGYHHHVPWLRGLGQPTLHPRVGSVVAVFRDPLQRLISAHRSMQQSPLCCSLDWGLGPPNGTRRRSFDGVSAAQFARMPGIGGCQTKMVLGWACAREVQLTQAAVARAVHFVEHSMAFVGLLAEWETTVCLWHARFGGALYSAELQAFTRSKREATRRLPTNKSYATAELDGFEDIDAAVYDTAVRRFQREVAENDVAIRECLQRVGAKRAGAS